MPFQSESQRRFLWANHPEIARRWTKKYGGNVPRGKRSYDPEEQGPKGASGPGRGPGIGSSGEGHFNYRQGQARRERVQNAARRRLAGKRMTSSNRTKGGRRSTNFAQGEARARGNTDRVRIGSPAVRRRMSEDDNREVYVRNSDRKRVYAPAHTRVPADASRKRPSSVKVWRRP